MKAIDALTKLIELCNQDPVSRTSVGSIPAIIAGLKGKDFIVFDNAGGMSFAVWGGTKQVKALLNDKTFLRYIHFGKAGKKEIVRRLPYFEPSVGMIKFDFNGPDLQKSFS